LLPEQDRSLWDAELVQCGLASLIRGEELARGGWGPYLLQAAIAACHARARSAAETDWERIVALYSALAERTPSPIVELNRAVAIGMAFGPEAALELVDRLAEEPSLSEYPFLPSVRADLLARLGRFAEARVEIERALPRVRNARDRALLLERAASYARRGLPA
jgi:predicted RNA polymerase sigma factor